MMAPALAGCADVTLRPQEIHAIELPANPTTGYRWNLAGQIPDCLELVQQEYVPDEATEGAVGAGGQEVYTFRAVGKGTARLVFEYRRSWEPERPPLQEKMYWIEVK